uniref:Uncharacterized protein n=1 Tax=Avena sativa TaxID=4498 RepID=A0ACD5Y2M3_AVESA
MRPVRRARRHQACKRNAGRIPRRQARRFRASEDRPPRSRAADNASRRGNGRRPSSESDVYSFGVVLLEIACGRRPTRRSDQAASTALLASVRDMYRRNVIIDAADRRLDGQFDRVQMERLLVTGLWCAHHDPVQRPSIAQAVVLRSEDTELPVVPTMGGSDEEIRALEGQAYGDSFAQNSVYLDEPTETTYLTTEDSAYISPEE